MGQKLHGVELTQSSLVGPQNFKPTIITSQSNNPTQTMSDKTTTAIPHMHCNNAAEAVEFYRKALGAEVVHVYKLDDGRVMHACIQVDGATIFVCDEFPEHGGKAPLTLGGSPITVHLQVADSDAYYNRAVEAGCKVTMPISDMFWGDRYGCVTDPYGHHWSFGTQIREVSDEEMQGVMKAISQGGMGEGCGNAE